MLFWPLTILTALVIAICLADLPADLGALEAGQQIELAALLVLAVALLLAAGGRIILKSDRRQLSSAVVFVGVLAGLSVAYSLRDEARPIIDGIQARLMPSVALSRMEGEAVLHSGWDGQFTARADIDGAEITMVVDTGATLVTLPYEAAMKIGIDPESLSYDVPVATANGRAVIAPVTLSRVQIGQVILLDVKAAVARPGQLDRALLGMSFLGRIEEFSMKNSTITLRN